MKRKPFRFYKGLNSAWTGVVLALQEDRGLWLHLWGSGWHVVSAGQGGLDERWRRGNNIVEIPPAVAEQMARTYCSSFNGHFTMPTDEELDFYLHSGGQYLKKPNV